MKIAAIIPARYESTRFRGKPLAPICGKPMIQWVYEAARHCDFIDQVLIATDHEEIRAAAEAFGARVCMTAATHATGTGPGCRGCREPGHPYCYQPPGR